MFYFSDFEERMIVSWFCFTSFANIIVRANNTFVSDTNYWGFSTLVTSNVSMNNFRFILVRFDFFLFNFFHYLWFSYLALGHNLFFDFRNNFRHNFAKFLSNGIINAFSLGNNTWVFLWNLSSNLLNFNLRLNNFFLNFFNWFLFNYYLLGVVIEIFRTLLDFNSDLTDSRFEKDFHIDVVEKTDHIFITIFVSQCVFSWELLKNWLDEGFKLGICDGVFWIHHMNLVSEYDFEDHKTFVN